MNKKISNDILPAPPVKLPCPRCPLTSIRPLSKCLPCCVSSLSNKGPMPKPPPPEATNIGTATETHPKIKNN